MFEGVVRPEDADLAIAEWPAIVEVGSDPALPGRDSVRTTSRV
jgi:hypothetical protein